MKPFKINRNSWHYKLNRHFFNNDYCMERRWEPKHNNFCSYWRATMFRVLFAAILTVVFGFILTMMGVGAYKHPLDAMIIVGSLIGFIAAIVGCAWLASFFDIRKKANADKPQSLFMQKYKAHKSKICPMVEYD